MAASVSASSVRDISLAGSGSLLRERVGVQGPVQFSLITGPMSNHGGPIQNAPAVYIVYWNWTSDLYGVQAYLQDFLATVGGTPWLSPVTQYSGAGNPSSLLAGTWSDPTTVPAHPTDTQIQTEAAAAVTHFGLGNSTNYQIVVALPTGHAYANFAVQGGTCAYHGVIHGLNVSYTALPYMPDGGSTCGSNWVSGPLDGVSILEGHELAESITDPHLNAWYDSGGNEIGDKCAWIQLGTISTSQGTFAVQPLWSNADNGCVRWGGSAPSNAGTLTQGLYTNGAGNVVIVVKGYGASVTGSYTPTALGGGRTLYGFNDFDQCQAPGQNYPPPTCPTSSPNVNINPHATVTITGFTANPGMAWLFSATAGGVARSGYAATYSYSNGQATWTWQGLTQLFGFTGSGTTATVITHQ